jgi:hypothetical protein
MEDNKDRPDLVQSIYQQQTLASLQAGVAKAAEARSGTYSERNPLLGKMVTCPYCRHRVRQNAQAPHCNPKLIVPAIDINADGNEIPAQPKIKGRKNPRLTRHRPPLFLMPQILLDLESEPELLALRVAVIQDDVEGQVHGKNSKWGHTPQKEIAPHHLASFIEKVVTRKIKLSAKRIRKIKKESRRRNRS